MEIVWVILGWNILLTAICVAAFYTILNHLKRLELDIQRRMDVQAEKQELPSVEKLKEIFDRPVLGFKCFVCGMNNRTQYYQCKRCDRYCCFECAGKGMYTTATETGCICSKCQRQGEKLNG